MKLWIFSDLHLTRRAAANAEFPAGSIPEADVCVVPGDLVEGASHALEWLGRTIANEMPVVFCPGNHEYYGDDYDVARLQARRQAQASANLHLLDNATVIIDGVRFVGGTLWTDYKLYARGEASSVRKARRLAQRLLVDHRAIWRRTLQNVIPRNWLTIDALKAHQETKAFIEQVLSVPHDGPTVVVTHHAPHPRSVSARFDGDPLTPAFVSDLSTTIDGGRPDLWIHGHTHTQMDYSISHPAGGITRLLCNPRGYDEENPDFSFRLVIEL